MPIQYGETVGHEPDESGSGNGRGGPRRPWWRRPPLLVAAAVLGALAVLYGLDLALTAGEVPRGVSVAGIHIGGLTPAAAEQKLRNQLTPRLNTPVQVTAGDQKSQFVPATAGVTVDWSATVAQAGPQPANPWNRVVSLFSSTDLDVVAQGGENAVNAALEKLRTGLDRAVVEGDIRFEGITPVAVKPQAGQALDLAGSRESC